MSKPPGACARPVPAAPRSATSFARCECRRSSSETEIWEVYPPRWRRSTCCRCGGTTSSPSSSRTAARAWVTPTPSADTRQRTTGVPRFGSRGSRSEGSSAAARPRAAARRYSSGWTRAPRRSTRCSGGWCDGTTRGSPSCEARRTRLARFCGGRLRSTTWFPGRTWRSSTAGAGRTLGCTSRTRRARGPGRCSSGSTAPRAGGRRA